MFLNRTIDQSSEHMAAVKLSKANLETARQELKDYKDKAQRILQVRTPIPIHKGEKGARKLYPISTVKVINSFIYLQVKSDCIT